MNIIANIAKSSILIFSPKKPIYLRKKGYNFPDYPKDY